MRLAYIRPSVWYGAYKNQSYNTVYNYTDEGVIKTYPVKVQGAAGVAGREVRRCTPDTHGLNTGLGTGTVGITRQSQLQPPTDKHTTIVIIY